MRSTLSSVCVLGVVVCFFLTFSFKLTSGRSYSKLEMGLAGHPWWTRVESSGRVTHETDPRAGSAFCGYAIPVLLVVGASLRRRTPRHSIAKPTT